MGNKSQTVIFICDEYFSLFFNKLQGFPTFNKIVAIYKIMESGNVNICAVKIYPKFSETTLILQPA